MDANTNFNEQVYGNLYQVAGSAGHPERAIRS